MPTPTTITLEQFSGPLDLLLSLIQEKKMSVSDVALSRVTEQYMAFVEREKRLDPVQLADFLVVAAKLLLLKSQSLLPHFFPEEQDEQSLEEQLRLYQAFQKASKDVEKRWLDPRRSYSRIEPPRKPPGFVWPANVSPDSLARAMEAVLGRLKPLKALPIATIDRAISLKQKIMDIQTLLKAKKRLTFFDVVGPEKHKTNMIVSFLALLELMKSESVLLRQEGIFNDIVIELA
ncbi:MAG: hypothetical protein A3G08_02155 [Candidatus Magasanikbacteria bacterium RIFCSPLOWO2_12_FULL_47_9b]|nr:MAG: hypothetical protein A3G08_02155 [Candidatus Magasanikbacteria bacterium RIFCSPLOWO2_12_FULL_47_9b]